MIKPYRVYFDLCCLNRPFDDASQDRVRLEIEAVLSIYEKCRLEEWTLLTSSIIESELRQTPNPQKVELIRAALEIATERVSLNEAMKQRTQDLVQLGFKAFDAAHIASAEALSADIFLSTDDRLIRRAKRYADRLSIPVDNPVTWLISLNSNQGGEGDENTI